MIEFLAPWAQLATPAVVLGVFLRLGKLTQAIADHARHDDTRFAAIFSRLNIPALEKDD